MFETLTYPKYLYVYVCTGCNGGYRIATMANYDSSQSRNVNKTINHKATIVIYLFKRVGKKNSPV